MSRTESLTEQDERIVAAAEADLQRLLAIEPSPEFAAQVRVRIHEQREPRATRWRWIGLAVATAAALIFAAMLRTNQSAPATERVEITTRPDTILHADPPTDKTPLPSTPATARLVAVVKESTRTVEAVASPEIIVDPAMTDAIRRMAMSLRNAEPDASTADQLRMQMGEPSPLTIAEPLNVRELVLKPAEQNGGNQD